MTAIRTKSFDRKGREVTMTVPANEKRASASQSAAEAYETELAETVRLLRKLAAKMQGHKAKASADPKNWGYVGDLQHMNSGLRDILGEE